MAKNINLVTLVLGDWSNDGHNQSSDIIFSTNSTKEEIMAAYMAGAKKAGVGFHEAKGIEAIFKDYEENSLYASAAEKLIAAGFNFDELEDNHEDNGAYWCCQDDAITIFKFLVGLSDKKIKLEEYEIPKLNGWWDPKYNFSIGYGLFSS